MKQLNLFPENTPQRPSDQPKVRYGGSQNPIVFHDYESYVAKFRDLPKTTDDTYTPPDVYEAVLQYLREEGKLTTTHASPLFSPIFPSFYPYFVK